jgi:hypothetical protein
LWPKIRLEADDIMSLLKSRRTYCMVLHGCTYDAMKTLAQKCPFCKLPGHKTKMNKQCKYFASQPRETASAKESLLEIPIADIDSATSTTIAPARAATATTNDPCGILQEGSTPKVVSVLMMPPSPIPGGKDEASSNNSVDREDALLPPETTSSINSPLTVLQRTGNRILLVWTRQMLNLVGTILENH